MKGRGRGRGIHVPYFLFPLAEGLFTQGTKQARTAPVSLGFKESSIKKRKRKYPSDSICEDKNDSMMSAIRGEWADPN